jgi:hypothetical protein
MQTHKAPQQYLLQGRCKILSSSAITAPSASACVCEEQNVNLERLLNSHHSGLLEMGPPSTTIRMLGSKKFAELRGVVKENAGKYCIKLCYNKKGNVGTCNTEARPCKHCCCGKAINITYSECVSLALGIQHPMCMRLIVICGLPGPKIFFHIIS